MQILWRSSLRACCTMSVNVFTAVINHTKTECPRLILRYLPNYRVDHKCNVSVSEDSISLYWPFALNDVSTTSWMQDSIKRYAQLTNFPLEELPRLILIFSGRDLPRELKASITRFLLQPQMCDATAFSVRCIELADTFANDYSGLNKHISKYLHRPKKFKAYFLEEAKKIPEKLIIKEDDKVRYKVTYRAASIGASIDSCLFEFRMLQEGELSVVKIECTLDDILEYLLTKISALDDEENILLITTLHPDVATSIIRVSRRILGDRVSFASVNSLKRISDDAMSIELFQKISQGMKSAKFIEKLYNVSTQYESLLTTIPEKSRLQNSAHQNHTSDFPDSCIFFYSMEKNLISYHIQRDGENLVASIISIADSNTEFLSLIEAAGPTLLIFWDAAETKTKFESIFCGDACRSILASIPLWCFSYADILINGSRGITTRDYTMNERMENYGVEVKSMHIYNTDGVKSHSSPIVSRVIAMIEYFKIQWEDSKHIKDFQNEMQSWVRDIFQTRTEHSRRFLKKTTSIPLWKHDIIKFHNFLLRCYVPQRIPLDLQHHWNWFSPAHLVPFVFGGTVIIGNEHRKDPVIDSKSTSHVAMVELAHNSGSLSRISETYINKYLRQRQIGTNKFQSNAEEIKDKIECLGPLHAYQALVYDIEATGLDIYHDRIVEIAIWDPLNNHKYESFVNPEMNIPSAVTRIHGIVDEDVASAPKFSSVAKTMVSFFKSVRNTPRTELLLIAHNSKKLDQHMLKRQFREANVIFPSFVHCLDSLPILFYCKKKFPDANLGNLRLNCLVDQFGVDTEGTLHRALTDAKSLWKVLEHLATSFDEKSRLKSIVNKDTNCGPTKHAMGYHSVISLIGHTIQENISEGVCNHDIDYASSVDRPTAMVKIRFPYLSITGKLTGVDDKRVRKILLALEVLRYVERVKTPDGSRRKAMKRLLESLEEAQLLDYGDQRIVDLIKRSLDFISD